MAKLEISCKLPSNYEENLTDKSEISKLEDYLTDVSIKFLEKYFSDNTLNIFVNNCFIRVSNQLTVVLGNFSKDERTNNYIIKINGKLLKENLVNTNTPSMVLDTLFHELVHFALYIETKGKHYKDGDRIFERELKKLNIGSSSTTKNKIFSKKNVKVVSYYIAGSNYRCNICNSDVPFLSIDGEELKGFKCSKCNKVTTHKLEGLYRYKLTQGVED